MSQSVRDLLLRAEAAERRAGLAEQERAQAEAAADHLWQRIQELQQQVRGLEARVAAGARP